MSEPLDDQRIGMDKISTRQRVLIDIFIGIVIPILCFAFDPGIFEGGILFGRAPFSRFALYFYCITTLECGCLLLWLVSQDYWGAFSRWVLGALLYIGFLFALLTGIALLPFSLVGIVFLGIGVLGFAPFITARVYLRNAMIALTPSKDSPLTGKQKSRASIFALIIIAIPLVTLCQMDLQVASAVKLLIRGKDDQVGVAIEQLKSYFPDYARMELIEYYSSLDSEVESKEMARIASIYKELTDDDIEFELVFD